MIDRGKRNLLGVLVDAVDYDAAVARIIAAAEERRGYTCTALAVHGVMSGVLDREQRHRLNALDLVTPDGQPVRWGLNMLHRTRLRDRVYGPNLLLALCEAAAQRDLSIYLYGGRPQVVDELRERLRGRFSGLEVAGAEPSRFRRLNATERDDLLVRVSDSGAALLFVGLGCPRQEVFAYECAVDLSMPVVAVGAAFDYHSGAMTEPSPRTQRLGLQWAHRLSQEPGRLWRRYLGLNLLYVLLLVAQLAHLWHPRPAGTSPAERLNYG
jgi:N-acetylglucosaminyldiphosphoundecaprenol N-acetyl-beta-D-mannosaminyltransferase